MLTTAVQVSVKIPKKDLKNPEKFPGVDNYECICYGDTDDKNTFYVMPQTVIYDTSGGKPVFTFYNYRGVPGSENTGGFAMFSVLLPQPDEDMKTIVKQSLCEGLKAKLEAKSKLICNMVKAYNAWQKDKENKELKKNYDDLKVKTGLNDADATSYIKDYKEAGGDMQFVTALTPENTSQIKLMAVNTTPSDVTITVEDNKKFYRNYPANVKPSGMGDNKAIFSISLSEAGAQLFKQALAGTVDNAAPVKIQYAFTATASLPAADVTVEIKSEQFKSVSKTIDRNIWGRDNKVSIQQQYIEKEAVKVDIKTFATASEMGMKDDEYNKWKQQLTDWGTQQLQQVLAQQTGLDMTRDLMQDAQGYYNFEQSIQNVKDFKRQYKSNTVVQFSVFPQTQLPSIASIVGKDKLPEYFKEYDLNDPFYQTIQPEFIVTTNFFRDYKIDNLMVNVTYGNNNDTIVFDGKETQKKTKVPWYLINNSRTYSYSYDVNFNNGKKYSSPKTETQQNVININPNEAGVVFAKIEPVFTKNDFEKKYSNIILNVKYSDPAKNISENLETRTINATNVENISPYCFPIGQKQQQSLNYQVEFTPKNGDSFFYVEKFNESTQYPGWGSTMGQLIQITDPLPIKKDYTFFIDTENLKSLKLVNITVICDHAHLGYKQTLSKNLTPANLADNPTFELRFDTMEDSKNYTVTYTANFVFSGGQPIKLTQTVPQDETFIIVAPQS